MSKTNSIDYSGLSGSERERLILLIEEMSESMQIITKILRYGYDSTNPKIESPKSNRVLLEEELGHVKAALTLLHHHEDLGSVNINFHCAEKIRSLDMWVLHNQDLKQLVDDLKI